ncbi:hypothetical protein LWX53_06470 [bacterium]|nr:hypothetical protein [bacterium]
MTFFGLPLLKVDEGYVDGASFMEGAVGNIHNDPNTNQAANLALWAEAGWFPSIWITDPKVRWTAVDATTALLSVPFERERETFVVRFDPATGLMSMMESMRYREAGESKRKILWITRNEKTPEALKGKVFATASATWLDQGKPWAFFELEGAAYNADVEAYVKARGS